MRKLLLLVAVIVAAGVIVGVTLYRETFDVYLTEEQLQERIEEPFPIEQRYLVIGQLTLSEPTVTLVEGSDRIHYGMRAQVSIAGLGTLLDRRGTVSGNLRYVASEAALYFDRLRIEELDTTGVPAEHENRVRDAIALALREALRWQPVYRLREDDLRDMAARLTLRDIRVVDGRLRLRLSLRRGGAAEAEASGDSAPPARP